MRLTASGQVFLLSPAWAGGTRYSLLLRPDARFEAAVNLREGRATVGEIYTFISGLYFRGKMAYATAFQAAPDGLPGALVILPGAGLVLPEMPVTREQLEAISRVPVEETNPAYRGPLLEQAYLLRERAGSDCKFILLGSIATGKYTGPLLEVFGESLLFPADFVGRGDMSRGGLMLRSARTNTELRYMPVVGAAKRGTRPPKLSPWRKQLS